MSHNTPYKNPTPTVDCLVEVETPGGLALVFIRRKNPPLGWALPGGFVDEGEDLATACAREVLEETGLRVRLSEQFFTYSDPKRDARKHTISTVFIGRAEGLPQGTDDADEAKLFLLHQLPAPLCFDHAEMVRDYLDYRKTGKRRML